MSYRAWFVVRVFALGSALPGCIHEYYRFPMAETRKLDGFDASRERHVADLGPLMFDENSNLVVELAGRHLYRIVSDPPHRMTHRLGRELELNSMTELGFLTTAGRIEPTRWRSIQLDGEALHAIPVSDKAPPITLPLADLRESYVRVPSWAKNQLVLGVAEMVVGLGLAGWGMGRQATGNTSQDFQVATSVLLVTGLVSWGLGVTSLTLGVLGDWMRDSDSLPAR